MKKEIKDFCKKHNISENQFYGKENIKGNLYLPSVTTLPDGFNPTVGGDLDLGSVTSLPEGFNPTVGGDLDLRSVTNLPDGFNPTVGGNLDLRSVTTLPDGFNPTVGGYLYLGSVTNLPDGFNSLQSWKNAKVKKPIDKINTPKNILLVWQNGKYVKADGIFTEVISKKGNVYKVKKIHSQKEFYLITDGKTHAHGETIEKAKEDFRFKLISDKLKKEPIKEDTIITIQYYRIVTGACELGVRNWIDNTFDGKEKEAVLKNGIKAKELLPILKKNAAYGLEKFQSLISF